MEEPKRVAEPQVPKRERLPAMEAAVPIKPAVEAVVFTRMGLETETKEVLFLMEPKEALVFTTVDSVAVAVEAAPSDKGAVEDTPVEVVEINPTLGMDAAEVVRTIRERIRRGLLGQTTAMATSSSTSSNLC